MSHSHSHAQTAPAQTEGVLIRWAPYYDFVTNLLSFGQSNRLRKLTIDVSLIKPGESLLDVGCGTGNVTIPGKQRVGPTGKAAGIDASPEMIAVAQQKAHRKNLEIDFRVGAVETLPFPDASFDVVTASLMIHHLPSDDLQRRAFAEIYRVLKPGGRFLIADMIRPDASINVGMLPTLLLHHGNQPDAGNWLKMLKQAGFRDVSQLKERALMIGFIRATK
jgi:ubiquinone/menaquinone biosynthesis C-methylase UbiE